MKAVKFALLAVLAACTSDVKTDVSFRDVSAPITSIALFKAADFAGHWDVIAGFGADICAYDVVLSNAAQMSLAERKCSGGAVHSVAPITGPGRYTPNGGVEHWVLWVDQTYRTAVIGAVSGEFGMILNRGRDIPADRLTAAREILQWNGYDLTRLQMRP